jgi:para-nitrobenzyl esterase
MTAFEECEMTHESRTRARCGGLAIAMMLGTGGFAAAQVSTASGPVEGAQSADGAIRVFRGIPFAAPPVGDARWKAPAPVAPWTTPRKTAVFGARCAQGPIFGDMIFRDEMSEDCLYVNVWTPAKKSGEKLPVMFWIHGGGFQAGSASEPRQDGEHLARKGVVVVSANHRLGVFGFLSHPDLTKESGKNASGNYGLLDQIAALEWVQRNIAAFGGDPGNVTIFGESAGSFAVSALVASPLAKRLVHKAIGESGAFFTMGGALAPQTLSGAEGQGATFAKGLGAADIAALRAKTTDEVLQAALKGRWFSPIVDGYVLPKTVAEIYAGAEHNPVPLLAGWNADEIRASVTLAKVKPTAASFEAEARKRYGASADAILKAYAATTDAEAIESAAALASDNFIGYATWKWIQAHAAAGKAPVYRFSFDRKIPVAADAKVNGVAVTAADMGARHAGEIEYVFGTLDSVPKVTWEPADRTLSEQMMTYWSNFARTGDPNGKGVPRWEKYNAATGAGVQHLDTSIRSAPDANRARYEALDAVAAGGTR